MVEIIQLGSLHTAYLDPFTGCGMLVVPSPDDDVRVGDQFPISKPDEGVWRPIPTSLHEAEWRSAVEALDALGWEPTRGDGGWLYIEHTFADGREVIGLFGREPIHEPELGETVISLSDLLATVLSSTD